MASLSFSDLADDTAGVLRHRGAALAVATLGIILLLADAAAVGHSIHANPKGYSTDFGVYYDAGSAIMHGRNPYVWSVDVAGDGDPHVVPFGGYLYQYPPLFAEALLPLHAIGRSAAFIAWGVVCAACAAVSLILLLRAFGMRVPWPYTLLVTAAVMASQPIRNDVYNGQANLVVLLLVVLTLFGLYRGFSVWPGTSLALAIVIKPFVGALLLYFIWKRKWRAALVAVLVSSLLLAVSFLPTLPSGTSAARGWITAMRHDASAAIAVAPNREGVPSLLFRLLSPNTYTSPWISSGLILGVAEIALAGVLLLGTVLALGRGNTPVSRRSAGSAARLLLETALVLGVALSLSPDAEGHHLLLLLPGLLGVALLVRDRSVRPSLRICLLGAWGLLFLCLASPLRQTLGIDAALTTRFAGSHPHGLAILWTGRVSLLLLAAIAVTMVALIREHQGVPEQGTVTPAQLNSRIPA